MATTMAFSTLPVPILSQIHLPASLPADQGLAAPALQAATTPAPQATSAAPATQVTSTAPATQATSTKPAPQATTTPAPQATATPAPQATTAPATPAPADAPWVDLPEAAVVPDSQQQSPSVVTVVHVDASPGARAATPIPKPRAKAQSRADDPPLKRRNNNRR
jgi:hypothetical protein